MNKSIMLLLALMLCLNIAASINIASCWKEWNRCSPKTAGFTSKFAYDCDTYCKKCKKVSGGTCVDAPSTTCATLLPNNKKCVCNASKKKSSLSKHQDEQQEKISFNPKCWGKARSMVDMFE